MMEIYAFKDIKIGFMEPFLQAGREVAIRTFDGVIQSEKIIMKNYKNDIELWKIGKFNDQTGDIIPEKEYIIGGKDIIIKEENR